MGQPRRHAFSSILFVFAGYKGTRTSSPPQHEKPSPTDCGFRHRKGVDQAPDDEIPTELLTEMIAHRIREFESTGKVDVRSRCAASERRRRSMEMSASRSQSSGSFILMTGDIAEPVIEALCTVRDLSVVSCASPAPKRRPHSRPFEPQCRARSLAEAPIRTARSAGGECLEQLQRTQLQRYPHDGRVVVTLVR